MEHSIGWETHSYGPPEPVYVPVLAVETEAAWNSVPVPLWERRSSSRARSVHLGTHPVTKQGTKGPGGSHTDDMPGTKLSAFYTVSRLIFPTLYLTNEEVGQEDKLLAPNSQMARNEVGV